MNITEKIPNKVYSADGTSIAYDQTGQGSALVLVHGTGADHTRWAAVQPRLSNNFMLYSLDRRGRGGSMDSLEYAIQREYEDIAAVAAAVDGPVDLLGHSFGAACALGAAPLIPNLRRLVLYEPPMLREQHTPQRLDLLQRMDSALAAGERETVVLIMLNEMLHVPLAAIERLRAAPAWAGALAAAHTIPRELRSSDCYGANLEVLQAITTPTLFLLGSASLESFHTTTQTLHDLLPNSQISVLPGQQHSAMLTAPELFAQEVSNFLLAK